MTRRRQEVSAFVAALGLHVAVLALLQLTQRESPLERASEASSAASWEIELAEAPPAEPASARELDPSATLPESSSAEARLSARFVPRADAPRTGGERSEAEPEMGASPESSPAGEPSAELEPSAAPAGPVDLGLGPDGWQRWTKAPVAGEAPAANRAVPRKNRFQVFRAQPKSTTGGLQEGLEAKDRTLGLGPEGRVLSALHQAAHTTLAPDIGVARFEVTVHRTGKVEVALAGASGRNEQWKKVAARIADDLRAKPPRLPPPREGAKFVVELIAERTLPNGTKATELKKPHLDVPPPKFQSSEAAKKQLQDENPTTTETPTNEEDVAIKLDAPGVYVAESGTVCDYRAGLGPILGGYRTGVGAGPTIQGHCDPSHIGAKPQRMVRARVLEQTLF